MKVDPRELRSRVENYQNMERVPGREIGTDV